VQNRPMGVQNRLADVQNLPSREMQFDVIISLYETWVTFLSFFLSFFHPSIPREDTTNWRGWKRINGWGMWLGLGFEGRILAGFCREEHAPDARASAIYLHGRGGAAQWICMVCLKKCSCTRQKSWALAGSCRRCFCNIFLFDDLV
jgi:hypothetical protein